MFVQKNYPSVRFFFFIMVLALTGCGTLPVAFESPSVTVSSFRLLPSSGVAPQFEIGLHIVNPNRVPLNLKGMSYTASIEGHKLISGVSNKLPVIAAYGEDDITITATPDVFGSIGLISDLVRLRHRQVSYNLKVKLDTGNFMPPLQIEKNGDISLSGTRQW